MYFDSHLFQHQIKDQGVVKMFKSFYKILSTMMYINAHYSASKDEALVLCSSGTVLSLCNLNFSCGWHICQPQVADACSLFMYFLCKPIYTILLCI